MSHSLTRERGEFMFGKVWQVVLSYTRPWTFRVQAAALVGMIVVAYHFAPGWKLMRLLLVEVLVIQVGVFSFSIAAHLKEQMDDWRSRLTPGFGLPHLGVGAVILGIVAVGIPMVLYAPLGMPMSGLLPACIAVSAVMASMVYEPLVSVIVGGLCGITAMKYGGDFVFEVVAGQHVAMAWGIAAVSAGMLAGLWFCLSRLSGEGISNDRPLDINFRRPVMTGSAMRTMGPLTSWLTLALRRQENAVAKTSGIGKGPVAALKTTWSRICHRGVVIGQGVNYWIAGAMGMLIFLAMLFVAKFFSLGEPHYGGGIQTEPAMLMVGFGPIYLSLFLCGLVWPQRWLNLAMESLLPASRRGFVWETGWAMGLNMFKLWVSSMAVALIGMGIISPHEFQTHAANLGAIVMVSAAGQVYFFGVIVWGLRLRNGICSVVALGVALAGSMPALVMQMPDKTPLNLVHAGIWIAALLGVGGVVMLDAYRRWVRTEMD